MMSKFRERVNDIASKAFWDEQAECDMEDIIDLEKFAEFIVNKCIEIDIQNRDAAPGEAIKEYFGV